MLEKTGKKQKTPNGKNWKILENPGKHFP